jgi:hypothetical protein
MPPRERRASPENTQAEKWPALNNSIDWLMSVREAPLLADN